MTVISFLRSLLIISVVGFIVTVVTTFLYSLIVHGTGLVDWELAVTFGLVLGISLPLVERFQAKK